MSPRFIRDAEKMFEELGLQVGSRRTTRGSHWVYALHYKGFQFFTVVAPYNNQNRGQNNNRARLKAFKNSVDRRLQGEDVPLPSGAHPITH